MVDGGGVVHGAVVGGGGGRQEDGGDGDETLKCGNSHLIKNELVIR